MDLLIFLILISLVAIAVLSGMLMYQYKMKIAVIEERMDKMVSIMNGMTQEMIAIKTYQCVGNGQEYSRTPLDMVTQNHYFGNQKIQVSDDEEDEDQEIEANILDETEPIDNIRFVNVDMAEIASEGSIPSLGELEEMHSETGSSEESIQEGITSENNDIFEVRKLVQTPEHVSVVEESSTVPPATIIESYETMSVAELKTKASELGLRTASDIKKMKRNELLELISSAKSSL